MTDVELAYIYALRDPQSGEVRYVGKSIRPRKRFTDHLHDARSGRALYRAYWTNSLLAQGLVPILEILEEVREVEWEDAERRWIAHFRLLGARLTNLTSGGGGLVRPSPDLRSRMSEAARRRRASPQTKAKLSEISRRRWENPAFRLEFSLRMKKKWADPEFRKVQVLAFNRPEVRQHMSRIHTGKRLSAEARAKTLAAVNSRREDPEYRARLRLSAAVAANRVDRRRRAAESMRQRWSDPVQRQKFLRGQRNSVIARGHIPTLKDCVSGESL